MEVVTVFVVVVPVTVGVDGVVGAEAEPTSVTLKVDEVAPPAPPETAPAPAANAEGPKTVLDMGK